MARESVGDALRTVHRALRPGGIFLDIHPEPDHGRISVRRGDEVYHLGHLDDTAYIRDIHAGRAQIASRVDEGLFRRGREIVFPQIDHISDVDTWLIYRQTRSSRSILDPAIVERARELLAGGEGEILISQQGYAAVLCKPTTLPR